MDLKEKLIADSKDRLPEPSESWSQEKIDDYNHNLSPVLVSTINGEQLVPIESLISKGISPKETNDYNANLPEIMTLQINGHSVVIPIEKPSPTLKSPEEIEAYNNHQKRGPVICTGTDEHPGIFKVTHPALDNPEGEVEIEEWKAAEESCI